MKLTSLFFVVAAAVLFLASPLKADPKGKGFTVYLTTEGTNRYGANIMVDAGEMNVEDMPTLFDEFNTSNGVSVLPASNEPVLVVVVVPKGASIETRKAFEKQVRDVVGARYPNMQLEIQESFVDLDADSKVLEDQLADVHAVQPKLAPGSIEADVADIVEAKIQTGLVENEQFRLSWFGKARNRVGRSVRTVARASRHPFAATEAVAVGAAMAVYNGSGQVVGWLNRSHPYNVVVAARLVALAKFTTSGMVILTKYGLNPTSAAIAAIAGGVGAAFGYNAKKWSNFCTSHTFPFFKEFWPVALYNRTGWFKSANINFFRSLGISYVLRSLAVASGQTIVGSDGERHGVPSPNSWDFLFGGLGLTIPEVWLDGLMDDSMRALELKGLLNHQSRSYILWGVSFIDTTMHSLFRAGAVKGAYAVATVSWGSKLAIWAAGRFLPAGPKRFVFVSEDVSKQANAVLHADEQKKLKEAQAAGQVVKGPGFFRWFARLVSDSVQEMKNWHSGKFTLSDHTMVLQNFGLDEVWNLNLKDEQKKRIEADPSLTRAEFVKWLNLMDADVSVVRAVWSARNHDVLRSRTALTLEQFIEIAGLQKVSPRIVHHLWELREKNPSRSNRTSVASMCAEALADSVSPGIGLEQSAAMLD